MGDTGQQLIQEGAAASANLIFRIFRVDVQKAIDPLTPAGFVRLQNQFARELTKISAPFERNALESALGKLDVDWPNLNAKQRTKTFQAANRALLPLEKKIPAATKNTIKVQTTTTVGRTRVSTKKKYKLDISSDLNKTDKRIAKFVGDSQGNFIRDEFGRRRKQFSRQSRAIVSEGLTKGLGQKQIAEDLERRLGFDVKKSGNYWTTVANSFVNRARSWAQLSSYRDAGIQKFQFEAVLDEVTTETCRFIHGKIFSVARGLDKFAEVEKKRQPEAVKEVTPWVRTVTNEDGDRVLAFQRGGKQVEVATIKESGVGTSDKVGTFSGGMSNKDLQDNGLTTPPLHGLCRSTLVPII